MEDDLQNIDYEKQLRGRCCDKDTNGNRCPCIKFGWQKSQDITCRQCRHLPSAHNLLSEDGDIVSKGVVRNSGSAVSSGAAPLRSNVNDDRLRTHGANPTQAARQQHTGARDYSSQGIPPGQGSYRSQYPGTSPSDRPREPVSPSYKTESQKGGIYPKLPEQTSKSGLVDRTRQPYRITYPDGQLSTQLGQVPSSRSSSGNPNSGLQSDTWERDSSHREVEMPPMRSPTGNSRFATRETGEAGDRTQDSGRPRGHSSGADADANGKDFLNRSTPITNANYYQQGAVTSGDGQQWNIHGGNGSQGFGNVRQPQVQQDWLDEQRQGHRFHDQRAPLADEWQQREDIGSKQYQRNQGPPDQNQKPPRQNDFQDQSREAHGVPPATGRQRNEHFDTRQDDQQQFHQKAPLPPSQFQSSDRNSRDGEARYDGGQHKQAPVTGNYRQQNPQQPPMEDAQYYRGEQQHDKRSSYLATGEYGGYLIPNSRCISQPSNDSRCAIYIPPMGLAYEQKMEFFGSRSLDTLRGIRKLNVGPPNCIASRSIVVLVVGPTGSGKSTFINGLTNFLYGVQRQDPFRYNVVIAQDERTGGRSGAQSQTRWVTGYTFHGTIYHPEYEVTVVDTPGYGDTEGIARDKETTQLIKKWFESTGQHGLDHLNGICFVIKSSETRLTEETTYQVHQVTQLFGHDMAQNVFPIITFGDGGKPPALQALAAGCNIPFNRHFVFNNSGIFPDSDADHFEEMFWQLGMKSYREFCEHMFGTRPVSLSLSADVLQKRRQLEILVDDLRQQLRDELMGIEEMKTHIELIRRFRTEADANNINIQAPVPRVVQVPVPEGLCSTNCLRCSITCHASCTKRDDDSKQDCTMIDVVSGRCFNCGCPWQKHKNANYTFELVEQMESIDIVTLQKRYELAEGHRLSTEQLLEKIAIKFMDTQRRIVDLLFRIQDAVNGIQRMAMAPANVTVFDYIQQLIQEEKTQRQSGYRERIEQLEALIPLADMVTQHGGQPGFDPFERYKRSRHGWLSYLVEKFPRLEGLAADLGYPAGGGTTV